MGRDIRKFTLEASVSRHNSPQDAIDDALWDDLVVSIRRLIGDFPANLDTIYLNEVDW